MRGPRTPGRVAFITLAIAFALALVVYWPALDSPFLGDDYRYLLASRDMSWGDFLHDAFVPWVEREASEVAADHWRPLSWTYFRLQYGVFGDERLGYHLTSFAAHLGGIVVVWFLARRLRITTPGAVVATVIFAIHPAGFESVTWISALSLVGFPLALAGWLAFVAAVEATSPARRLRLHVLALVLITIGLLNRETVVAVFPAMGFWLLLVHAREHLRDPRAYLPLAPYFALFVLYTMASTWFFTAPGDQSLSADADALRRTWFYVKQALAPADLDFAAFVFAQRALGVLVLISPFIALATRRWLALALILGFLASIVPYGLFNVGYGPRYFYFPSAFLALALGAVAMELWPLVTRIPALPNPRLAVAGTLAATALVIVAIGNNRVDRWVEQGPEQEERWINELLQTYSELPDDGILYVTNVPFHMALLNGFVLEPTVSYLYPGAPRRVQMFYRVNLEEVRPYVRPQDRLFVPGE